MEPKIARTHFGGITIQYEGGEETEYCHDLHVQLDGKVRKRKKKLSKAVYGTSHTLSLAEAEHIFEIGAELLVIGTGQFGLVSLSDEAAGYFAENGVDVILRPTPEVVQTWNQLDSKAIGLFHVTC